MKLLIRGKKIEILNVEATKKILRDKVEFIKEFITQLKFELYETDELYRESENSID